MSRLTRLEPLRLERARQRPDTALAWNGDGRVIGAVPADDPEPERLLGDLDVFA